MYENLNNSIFAVSLTKTFSILSCLKRVTIHFLTVPFKF